MVQNSIVLNVAEKPSVARSLAQVFLRMDGAARDRGMRREAHQIFTAENVMFPSVLHGNQQQPGRIEGHTMVTTSVRGHLASQDFPGNYGWSNVDPIVLFEAPIETTYRDDLQPLERMLSNLSRSAAVLILWLDCDREGEAIGAEVKDVCVASNPRLQVYRARFSTLLQPEIKRALYSLGRLNLHLVHAVQARSELDLRVGAAFTRFQTLRLQRKFDGLESVVSYGPCQFPTLGFVVERWARIETFVPTDFWFIDLAIQHENRLIQFTWKRQRLYDAILTTVLYEQCVDHVDQATVTSLTGRPKSRWRPVPLATVELQKRASRFLRIGSEALMTAAEDLYNKGIISYPRTETEKFRPEFEHRPLIQQLATLQQGGNDGIGEYANKLLTDNNFQTPRAGQHDDQAHPPITPCKAVDPNTITDATQRSVYLLICKHYLACCSRDATGRETELTVSIASEEFSAKGLMILEQNWLEIYHPWERWSTGQGNLPPLQVGSRVVPSSLLMKQGTTQPPSLLSEVELISLMDRHGIGTDATIAQHIATIQEREYCIQQNQKFSPTPLGIALVEGYNSMGYQLNKPDLRRETEAECNEIAHGRKTKDVVIATILAKMKRCYETAVAEAHKLDAAMGRHFSALGSNQATTTTLQANFSECGTCGSSMALKQQQQGRGGGGGGGRGPKKLLYCNSCRVGWNLPRGQVQAKTANDQGEGPPVKCPICNYQVIRIMRGDGYEGNGYHVCPKCFSDPPGAPYGETGGDFRCFACQHPTCQLAGGTPSGDIPVFSCRFCAGSVCIRKNSAGFVLSCNARVQNDRCPYTIWLPKACQTVSLLGDENQDTTCMTCSGNGQVVRLINMVWKPGSVPPNMGRDCNTCVLCDVDFRRVMEVSLPVATNQVHARRREPTARGGRGGGRGYERGGNRGRGRATIGRGTRGRGGRERGSTRTANAGGGNTCYRCGQPGHYANNCPNA